ncbi:MAG: hypothetical protein IJ113_01640 [Eggerthellaceae bacterium]|nr:hypothetical protein [Eggerthellaceae bacterium]
MCVIVYKPAGCPMPGTQTLKSCWTTNPDGAGMMFPANDAVRIRKGFMEWNAFEDALSQEAAAANLDALPVALHFRIATHGAVKPGCCHPFPVCGSASAMRETEQVASVGFMHNGVLSGLPTTDAVSDSMSFAKRVLSPLDRMSGDLFGKDASRIIGASAQGSRFLLMDGSGEVRTFGRWVAEDGIMFSNDNFHRRQSYGFGIPFEPNAPAQASLFDAYEAFAEIDRDNPKRYGLYEACAGCDLMEECAEYLPYCATAEDAERMAAACQDPAAILP